MPAELVTVDHPVGLQAFSQPFRQCFDPAFGRPSVRMETCAGCISLRQLESVLPSSYCASWLDPPVG